MLRDRALRQRRTARIVDPEPNQPLARTLVRLHGEPLGYLTQPLENGRLDVEALFSATWAQFAADISAHLAEEGLAPIDRLATASRPAAATGACPNRGLSFARN